MDGARRFFARLAALFHQSRTEKELDEEIRFHLEMEAAENRRRGLEPREAWRAARLRFGGVESVKAAYREEGRLPWLEVFFQDAAYALRRMARAPAFTAAVVATLALGIGATSALWSVVDAVLLRPLPYPHPERLTAVVLKPADDPGGDDYTSNTWSTFEFVRDNAASFEHLAASSYGSGINLATGQSAEYVDSLRVSADYFAVLGILPERGREFSPDEEAPGSGAVVVLSHDLWRRHFGDEADALGSTVELGGEPHTVIGVMPEGFRSLSHADVWRPLRDDFEGSGTNLQVLGRLRPEVPLGEARGELEALDRWPERPSILAERWTLQALPYRDLLTEGPREDLMVLLGAVVMVLAIACANVACLLLVAGAARRREMALRRAVGGGRRRLVRQLLTESLLLALAGGALGVAVAHAGVRALLALAPAWYLETWEIAVDARVLVATLVVALATGFVFGLAPALAASRCEPRDALAEGGGKQAGGRRSSWSRRALVVAEVALSVLLLIGAGLLIRTLYNFGRVELGFDPQRVLTAQMSFEGEGYAERQWYSALYEQSLERIRRLPGVEMAAVASALPVERGLYLPVEIPSSPRQPERTSIFWIYISPDYFRLLSVPLVAGRGFDGRDTAGSAPVALANKAFVRRFFDAGENVLGLEVRGHRIVGVVGDFKDWGLKSDPRPTLYVPVSQVEADLFTVTHRWFPAHWLVRLRQGVRTSPVQGMQEAVRSFDPRLPFSGFRKMDAVISGAVAFERFRTVLLGVFAALALVMAVAGLYGLLAYSVTQRTREIGVRVALGASRGHTLRLIAREGLALSALGIAIGCAGALALARILERFVYGVSATDPATYAEIVVGFLLVALAASVVPGLKALRLDVVTTLREE